MPTFAVGHKLRTATALACLIAVLGTHPGWAGSNCLPISAPALEIAVTNCAQAWPQLQATGQFPDVFAGAGKTTGLCYASTGPVPASIGNAAVMIAATLSGWTTDFTPVLLGGTDNLGTVVTELTIAGLHGNSQARLFTRDTIDLSQIFTTGIAAEEDVIVGGSGYLTGAQGTYRIASTPEDPNAEKVRLTGLSGEICLDGN
jgi:hypothetical protein